MLNNLLRKAPKKVEVQPERRVSVKFKSREESKQILEEMQQDFLEGDRATVQNLVHRYFSPKNSIEFMIGEKAVRVWLLTLKRRFRKDGMYFGNIDDLGNYGICLDKHDYAYVFDILHKQAKGLVQTAVELKREAQSKGLLPEGTSVRLLAFDVHKEKKDE